MKRALYYLHQGLADWEASFILPELKEARYTVETLAESKTAVTTMGGLKILPDHIIKDLNLKDVEIIILPGGTSWKDFSQHKSLLDLLPTLNSRGIAIAAICDATLALAHIGLLDHVRHTSNQLANLKASAPSYQGEALYVADRLAVTDHGIITASGIGALEFAHEIINELVLMTEEEADEWFEFFKEGIVPHAYRNSTQNSQEDPSFEAFSAP